MDDKQFASLVSSLETFASKNPGVYKFRVGALGALGYVYLLLVVSILLGIVAALLSLLFYEGAVNVLILKVVWIPLVLVGIVLRSLWITIPVPDGTELTREQAPGLFELIHEVTKTLNGPKIHHVLLNGDFNAGIVQIPQFGMMGWLNNYLVVGLPLLQAFTPAEFRAILAHEVGHLSGKHGRFSGWIYRLRRSWIEVLTRVHHERHYASFLFEPFLNWYAPYLNAYSFVLARAQERQADEYAVELAGKEIAAVTLARFAVKGKSIGEDFWPGFFRLSKQEPKAPRDPFAQMLGKLEQSIGPVNAQRWFYEELRVPTGYGDTHPALSDRLAAIGYGKDSPEVTGLLDSLVKTEELKQPAASHYLRELPEDFVARQDRILREQIVRTWNEAHKKANESKKRFDELEVQAKERALSRDEQWERVALLAEVQDQKAAIPSLRTILQEHPDDARAHFAMGAILLEQQDAEGIKHLEQAMELKPLTIGNASTLLSGFYFQRGDKELAEQFRRRAAEYYEDEERRNQQAVNFSNDDSYIPHDVNDDLLKEIKSELNKARGLSEAYLFRKVIDGGDPVYVLAFFAGYSWQEGRNAKHLEPLFNDLMNIETLPTPLIFLPFDVKYLELLPKVSAVPGSLIYKRAT
jgi:Zn-dependent protease with chaperone function